MKLASWEADLEEIINTEGNLTTKRIKTIIKGLLRQQRNKLTDGSYADIQERMKVNAYHQHVMTRAREKLGIELSHQDILDIEKGIKRGLNEFLGIGKKGRGKYRGRLYGIDLEYIYEPNTGTLVTLYPFGEFKQGGEVK